MPRENVHVTVRRKALASLTEKEKAVYVAEKQLAMFKYVLEKAERQLGQAEERVRLAKSQLVDAEGDLRAAKGGKI